MKHTDKTPFRNAPRNIRVDAGLRLRDITEMTGLSTSLVSRLENDRRNPTALTLALFYAACGRDDLVEVLLHVLDDDAQTRVFRAVDRKYESDSRAAAERARV